EFPDSSKLGSLDIDLKRGFIEVLGCDQPGVTIEVLAPSLSKENGADQELMTRFTPRYDVRKLPGKNEIKFDANNQDYILNLRIRVPRSTKLTLQTYRNGYVDVNGVLGEIDVRSQHCDIRLVDAAATTSAYSYNGSLTASYSILDSNAKLDFETYNGDITLSLPASSRLSTAVSANSGRYQTDFALADSVGNALNDSQAFGDLRSTSQQYDFAEVNGGGTPVRLECEKGRVVLRKRK
ncbi:MAG: DUF4097 family beta strand repeat-containing protein, partial [Planctomycetota bacterium]